MVTLGNFDDNYDTSITANKSMGFNLSATQSCRPNFIFFFNHDFPFSKKKFRMNIMTPPLTNLLFLNTKHVYTN